MVALMPEPQIDALPYRFYREEWEHQQAVCSSYHGISMLTIGKREITVAIIPYFPKTEPYWPMGWLPESVDNPKDAFEARYFTAFFSDLVITNDDVLAGTCVDLEVPNFPDPDGIFVSPDHSKIRFVFLSSNDFERVAQEADLNLENLVPANQRVTAYPIKGELLRGILAEHLPKS